MSDVVQEEPISPEELTRIIILGGDKGFTGSLEGARGGYPSSSTMVRITSPAIIWPMMGGKYGIVPNPPRCPRS